ncbi:putative DNA-binding protein [Marinicrinis lubricantis]|uniref:UPF0122 protein ACFPXP_07545 n=1 Tax=Marinicrinis lubricantis TaxID=2086470 RepID=A0ABW1IMI8_9BACL
MEVLEKVIRINLLMDFYEPLLTEKQRSVLRYYYVDNFSLSEIADLVSTSRQAVNDHLKRAEQTLEDYETKLNLVRKHESRVQLLEQLREAVSSGEPDHADMIQWLEQLEELD